MNNFGSAAMALSKAKRRAIPDPRMNPFDHNTHRRDDRWHPYRSGRPKWKRSLFSSIPSPEASSKETSPKAQSFQAKERLLQAPERAAGHGTDTVQLPSPPPSDRSDQSGKTGDLSSLSQSTAQARLQKMLAEPIHWVSATQKTFDTEMAAVARSQSRLKSLAPERPNKPTSEETIQRPRPSNAEPSPDQTPKVAEAEKATQSQPVVEARVHPEQQRKDRLVSHLIKSGRVSKTWPEVWAKGRRPRGLSNPGQYCYRRSVMQAFLQTPVFITWLEAHKAPAECPSGNSRCIACTMRALMRSYYRDQPVQQALRNFDKCFNVLWPQTRLMRSSAAISALNSRQQDADEFVTGLLDAFCDAPRRTLPMPTEVRDALFNMSISQTWRCANEDCKGRDHTTVQSERGLILDIRKPREHLPIKDYITQYFKGDILEEVTCDVCKRKQRRRPRHMQLLAGPEILIIQLRRFYHLGLGDRSNGRKCFSRVGQLKTLDLNSLQPSKYHGTKHLSYELKHTIVHQGSGISNGHYVSLCTGPTGLHICDDSSVTVMRKGAEVSGVPYLLVYTKKSGSL